MPFSVRMPDGTVIQGIPDGTPKEAIRAKWVKGIEAADRERYSPMKGMTSMQVGLAGAGRQMAGRARSLGNALGLVSDDDMRESQQLDAPLKERTAAKVGAFGADVAMSLPLMRGGFGAAAGGGAAMGFTDPDTDPGNGMDRLAKTAIGGGLGAAGYGLGKWAGQKIAGRLNESAILRSQDAPKRKVIEAGMKMGLVVPPASTNPKLGNRMLESFAGKEAIEQEAALANAPIMQDAMRRFLGLPRSSPMTVDVLKQVRDQAGSAYDEVKGLGGAMMSDARFLKALDQLEGSAGSASRSFPGLGGNTIRETLAPLRQLQFRGDDAVDAIKALREGSKRSFAQRESGLGRAQLGAAKELEDLIERNIERQAGLGQVGKDYAMQTLNRFREARKTIAKTYAVEGVMNRASGSIDGSKAAKMLAKGAPLTGEMKTIAEFAAATAPTITKESKRSAGVNALTTLFGVEAAMLGHPAPLLLPPARYGMGKALLSKSFQRARALPDYSPSLKGPRAVRGLGRVATPAYFALDPEEDTQQ